MKKSKILISLLIVIALFIAVGFTAIIMTDNSKKSADKTTEKNIESPIESEQVLTQAQNTTNIAGSQSVETQITQPEADLLSAEDKAVKAEIAKYINTTIDFRYNRKETLNGKNFDITFDKVEKVAQKNCAIYKNDLGDKFIYNANSGKLFEAIIDSALAEKTTQSIDKNTSQKIAIEYANSRYEMTAYKEYYYKETEKGHYFTYTRYIGGYPSNDKFSVKIGNNGNIVYLSDFTDTFDGKNINYDKSYIDAKIKEHIDESEVDWDSLVICIDQDKVAVNFAVPKQNATATLNLEE